MMMKGTLDMNRILNESYPELKRTSCPIFQHELFCHIFPSNFSGIKGGGIGYFTSIDVGIENNFINTPVVFSKDISDNGYGILGQQGFFNNYKINFDYNLREIELTPNKK